MIRFIKFCIVGALNTAFGVGVYCLFIFLGMDYKIATLLSTILGVIWNFKTTGIFVFKNKDNRLFFRFILCYAFLYLVNIGLVWLFKRFGMNDYYGGIFATPFMAICSFFLLKEFVYVNKA